MQELELEDAVVMLYASAEELPAHRYAAFNKYLCAESGLGSDLPAIGAHFAKCFEFASHRMYEEIKTELKNTYYAIHSMLNELNFPAMAFMCTVHSIDGNPLIDMDEQALRKTWHKLGAAGLQQKQVNDHVQAVKKKFVGS